MGCVIAVCIKETELFKLRTIMCQSAFERLRLEKHIAENNVQTVGVKCFLLLLENGKFVNFEQQGT